MNLKAMYECSNIPDIFNEMFLNTDSYISKIKEINFENIIYLLKDNYEVMPQNYYDFFKFVVEYKLDEYERKLIRYR